MTSNIASDLTPSCNIRVTDIEENNFDAHMALGEAYLIEEKYEDALRQFRKVGYIVL